MNRFIASFAVIAALSLGSAASAAVVVGPNVGGYATFTDTNTGLNWVKLDSFFDLSHNRMAALVTAAGFTVAERPAVETLLNSLSLGAGEWAGYKAIMGDAPNRELIWGSYAPVGGANLVGWAFAYDNASSWSFVDITQDADVVPNGGSNAADMNIWAFVQGGGVIPEPATWAMMIAGFGLVGFAARRRGAAIA